MFEWLENKWIIIGAISIFLLIFLDEMAYRGWKKTNPGHLYSHLRDKTITPVDPSRPPTTIYYE